MTQALVNLVDRVVDQNCTMEESNSFLSSRNPYSLCLALWLSYHWFLHIWDLAV